MKNYLNQQKSKRKKSLLRCSKKGNVTADSMLFLIVMFGFGIAIFLGYFVLDAVNTDIQAIDDLGNETKDTVATLHSNYPSTFDSLFALAFGLMWLFVVIASWMIDSNPIFFAIVLVVLVGLLMVAGTLTNVYEDLTLDDEFGSLATNFPMMNFIAGHFIEVIIAISMSIAIVLYGKSRVGV